MVLTTCGQLSVSYSRPVAGPPLAKPPRAARIDLCPDRLHRRGLLVKGYVGMRPAPGQRYPAHRGLGFNTLLGDGFFWLF